MQYRPKITKKRRNTERENNAGTVKRVINTMIMIRKMRIRKWRRVATEDENL